MLIRSFLFFYIYRIPVKSLSNNLNNFKLLVDFYNRKSKIG